MKGFLLYTVRVSIILNMKVKPLGFWQRFGAVFTPTFLSRLSLDKEHGKSWGFWFLSNLFLAIIPFIALTIFAAVLLAAFPNNAVEKIPTDVTFELPSGESYNLKTLVENFGLTFNEDFELETANLPDPMILAVSKDEGVTFVSDVEEIDQGDTEFVFLLDTKERTTETDDIIGFENAFFLLHDKFVATDEGDGNIEIIRYADTIGGARDTVFPFTIDLKKIADSNAVISSIVYSVLLVAFIATFIFFAVFRLVFALIWALVFWAVGEIVKVKDWSFEKSFMAMLHFSFVTLLLCPLGMILGLTTFWSGAIWLAALFGMNFHNMKKKA